MTTSLEKYKYTQFRHDLESVFKAVKTLLLERLENSNEYWMSVDLRLTKKDPGPNYNFPQATDNFNKMLVEKEKRRKKYEEGRGSESRRSRRMEKKKERKKKAKDVSSDDSDSSSESTDKTKSSNAVSKSLVSSKSSKFRKQNISTKKDKNNLKQINTKEKSASKKSNKKRKSHKNKKYRYFPNLDDDILSEDVTSEVKKDNKRTNNNETTNQNTSDATLDTDINIKHYNEKRLPAQREISLSKIDPKLLSTKNSLMNYHRDKTLRFLREACCNSRILLFKPRKECQD